MVLQRTVLLPNDKRIYFVDVLPIGEKFARDPFELFRNVHVARYGAVTNFILAVARDAQCGTVLFIRQWLSSVSESSQTDFLRSGTDVHPNLCILENYVVGSDSMRR